jgi:hypothetical protein
LKLFIELHHALVSLRVPDRDRRLIRERRKQISIITEVWIARTFLTKAKKTNHISFLDQRYDHICVKSVELERHKISCRVFD